ncbi:Copia-type Polyprotein [Phytophthora palmivora]|uniref:Copia-type Polyprotein n=1 Tax=Phytophthora palmivora TaxID=4796 RepID=A0A2P4XW80_9STRA|nr:Copia-type Polyprotein [Phytophthora palmivora]
MELNFCATHAYTPEENAFVEKLNGVLVNKTRTAMQAADMPTALWPEALQYIVEIDNMSATRALNGRTPFEKLHGKKPDLNKVRVCGAIGFVYVAKRKNKLSSKAEPALLLGVSRTVPGYRLLHLRTGKIVEACDVQFREDVTVGKKYLSALLVGRHNSSITFQFVAEEGVHEGASRTVVNSLPDSVTSSYRELVDG